LIVELIDNVIDCQVRRRYTWLLGTLELIMQSGYLKRLTAIQTHKTAPAGHLYMPLWLPMPLECSRYVRLM